MEQFPHRYSVVASARAEGEVMLESPRLVALVTAPPAEFGGPGDRWSPETLCVGAVADCFVLTFRALARAEKLPWASLRCCVEGTLDRVDRATQFTAFLVRVSLDVSPGIDEARALRLLERTEQACLITNSLKGASRLEAKVQSVK
jgi:organic hydroperoxide reductase OsmC/OhrA